MDESTKFTAKHPVWRILLSVVFPLEPENIRIGGSNETIESQLFGAAFGSPALLLVEMSTMGPGIRLGDHFRLSIRYSTFLIARDIVAFRQPILKVK